MSGSGPGCRGALLALAGLAWAGSATLAGGPETEADLARQILEHDRDREVRVVGVTRVRLSHPQEVSAALGALVVRQPVDYDCSTACEFRGLLVQAEPGWTGASVSAGYAVVTAEKLQRKHFLADVYWGYGIKGVLMRTWDGADLEPASQTLLGAEGDFTVIGINFSLALLRPISSGETEDDWVVSGGIGWGF